ncbi:Ribosomal protein S6 [Candidatus Magnetoovum chiemensis]|nr:Ribosomal protein S6 [Candidatus Magnetoovum chiemensis]
MNYYENIVILDASVDEETIVKTENKIRDVVEKDAGQLLQLERWGRRKLAYMLNKHEAGYYILFIFKAPSTTISTLEGFYKVYEHIFKSMVIRLGKKEIQALEKSLQSEQKKDKPQEEVKAASEIQKQEE